MARVLVGIPTFNRGELVQQTILSLLAQTYGDWVALVSDNASQVETRDQVREFVRSLDDQRIQFHQQACNQGEYGQGRLFFARGLQAHAEYLLIIHDDDVMEPDFLEVAVAALDQHRQAAFFVCNPCIIDGSGSPQAEWSRRFDKAWGREGTEEGFIDVLGTHMDTGFTPISGAFLRMSALSDSGFVDPDFDGCFPFESNVFLRLGELGAKAWFTPRRLFRLRWHQQQMTNWGFLNNEDIVSTTIRLFERRRFSGRNEQRRRQLLGRLHRIKALHRAREGDGRGARQAVKAAVRANGASLKTLTLGLLTWVMPGLIGGWVRAAFGPRTYSRV